MRRRHHIRIGWKLKRRARKIAVAAVGLALVLAMANPTDATEADAPPAIELAIAVEQG